MCLSPCYDLHCFISVSGECFHVSIPDVVKYISVILIDLDIKKVISAPDELVRYWVCGFVVKWDEKLCDFKNAFIEMHLGVDKQNTDIIVIEMTLIWWNELLTKAHTQIR